MASPEYRTAEWRRARAAALIRAHHRCERCGSTGQLVVHHRDGHARGRAAHRLSNLEVVCRRCHIAYHRPELLPGALEARVWPPKRD